MPSFSRDLAVCVVAVVRTRAQQSSELTIRVDDVPAVEIGCAMKNCEKKSVEIGRSGESKCDRERVSEIETTNDKDTEKERYTQRHRDCERESHRAKSNRERKEKQPKNRQRYCCSLIIFNRFNWNKMIKSVIARPL